jgi:Spy/CpxP family protein refolding chaperone
MDKQTVDVVDMGRSAAPVESGKARRWLLASTALVALALVAGTAVQSQAHAFPGSHGGPMGFGRGMHGPMDPATMGKKIDAMVGWVLADIDATPTQREKIVAILKGAANDLAPLREQHRAARKQSLALLAAPTIDRAQLEKIRLEQVQLGETSSRRMFQAMLDSAEVLSPEQRVKLVERWQRRGPPRK